MELDLDPSDPRSPYYTGPDAAPGAGNATGVGSGGATPTTAPTDWASDPTILAYARNAYQSLLGKAPDNDDVLRQIITAAGGNVSGIHDAIAKLVQAPTTAPASTPTGGPAAAPTGTLTGLLAPFQGQFTAPTPQAYPTAPSFTPPSYTPPPAFVPDQFSAPSYADAQNDPGYQFAADEGQRALTQSKAAGGVLNTGGTLKDILAWGQNYAAQRYGDVYNRNYNTWQGNEGAKERAYATNYGSQYLDPYKFAYQGALDTFNPQQQQWQTNMASTQRGNENDYANAYEQFLQSYRQFQDQRDSTFDKSYKYFSG